MKKILVLATAGAGGDLQPLLAAALALRERGHSLVLFGDGSVAKAVQDLGLEMVIAPPEHNLGPRLVATIKAGLGLDPAEQGRRVEVLVGQWSDELAALVHAAMDQHQPDLLVTSLFGAGVARQAASGAQLPWCVINSTFYMGPNPPREMERDFTPRAMPLMRYFISQLGDADLVLHATDQVFDFGFANLPARHHYTGPLIWEAPGRAPDYLSEPGDLWALVTLSSQEQDDLPLAQAALDALAGQPLRVTLTIGGGHQPGELKRVPANAHVEQYLPHTAVLKQSRLLISHAGHGSVMKALWHGVPMVLVPWGRDQPGVAARAARLGAAAVVERAELTPETLSAAIERVLADGRFLAAAQQTARRLRAEDPPSVACEWLEQL